MNRKMFSNKQYTLAKVRFKGREEILKGKSKIKSLAKKPAVVIQEMLTGKRMAYRRDTVYFPRSDYYIIFISFYYPESAELSIY